MDRSIASPSPAPSRPSCGMLTATSVKRVTNAASGAIRPTHRSAGSRDPRPRYTQGPTRAPQLRTAPLVTTTTSTPATTGGQQPGKLIYTFAEGNAQMRELLGGKGANLAEMTNIGLPGPARLHHHHRGLQRLLRGRQAVPDGLWDQVVAALATGARDRQGLRRRGEPAPRLRPLRRQVLHARHDGHRPQPGPQPGNAAGPHHADRQRRASPTTRTAASSSCSADIVLEHPGRDVRRARSRR